MYLYSVYFPGFQNIKVLLKFSGLLLFYSTF